MEEFSVVMHYLARRQPGQPRSRHGSELLANGALLLGGLIGLILKMI